MGNICSIFGSSVGKTDLPPSSLRHLGVRSSSSGSIYVDGLGNCADSNGPESFVDNNLSYPSLDEFGQVDHDNDNYSSNSFHQKDDDYVLVNEVAENDAIDDDDRYVLVAGASFESLSLLE